MKMTEQEFRLKVIADLSELRAEQKNTAHDVRGLTIKLDAYATTRDLSAVCDRVKAVESNQSWTIRSVGALVLAGLGSFFAAKGLH